MPRIIFDANGDPQFVPDEGDDAATQDWHIGPSGIPQITVRPIGGSTIGPTNITSNAPSSDTAEQLGELILNQEGDTQRRSPLRDAVPLAPSEGVDHPTPSTTYEQFVEQQSERRLADLERRRAELPDQSLSVDDVTEAPKQFIKGAFGATASLPFDAPAMAMDLLNLPGVSQVARSLPMTAGPATLSSIVGTPENIGAMHGTGEKIRNYIGDVLGAKRDNLSPGQTLMRNIGESYTPFGPAPKITAAVLGAGRSLLGNAITPASAEPSLSQTPVIESVGGPTKISLDELKTLGGVAAVSIGMAFAPAVFSKLKLSNVPNLLPASWRVSGAPRPVREAAPGTVAISKPGDLARTYDDVNAGAMRILRRAGVSMQAAERVWTTMRIQTRATANALADSAVNMGRMETPAFTFQSRVPLAQLSKLETNPVRDYLHVMDTIDDLKMASISNRAFRNPQAGPITIRGQTLADAWQMKQALEAAHPEVINISKAYKDNLKALRKFETTGEYATLSTNKTRFLNAQNPNMVPFKGARVTGDPHVERGSAVNSLAEHMRAKLRDRIQNEAVGLYVDEARKVNPRMFVPVTAEELKANSHWRKNTVTFKRRGNTEHYTTDPLLADILRMDPYYMQSIMGQAAYSTKRLMEMGTTGEFAPWFAVTSAIRSYQIGKITAEKGFASPSILGTMKAIPQQLLPQLASVIGPALNRGSNGWLGQVFGPGNMQALSTRLAHAYERSLFAQLQTVGGGRGSIMQQQMSANNRLAAAIKTVSGPLGAVLEGYRALLNSLHNAPAFNYASKNRGKASLPELAAKARDLTGDPRIGGEFMSKAMGSDKATPIRFVNEQSRLSQTLGTAAKGYGLATEFGRASVPWFNATMQGVKRIGEAYLENPAKFIARAWLYQMTPAAVSYLISRAAGTDPNGRSYVDHHMNGRSEYNRMMNFYVAVPGRPAEDGIEFPGFHEMTMPKHMMEVALDHAFRSALFPQSEDFWRTAANFLGIVVEPPAPPILNIGFASQGMMGPQGAFTGEAYRKRNDPFDQNGGLPNSIELYARAAAPGIADIAGTGAAAYTQTPKGFFNGVGNGILAGGRRIVEKTPIVRDVLNMHAPVTGNTQITDELFKKNRAINQLVSYYKTWDQAGGLIGVKPRSAGGEDIAAKALGPRPPGEAAGLNQPQPTNPLYNIFMSEMMNRFTKDAPKDRKGQDTGAIGFLSLWNRYGVATKQLQRIKKVNEGNNVTWQTELAQRPKQLEYLRSNGVDPTNLGQVRNFYERQRQDAARVLLFTIKGVENDFSKQIGKPFKIEDLNPYGKGLEEEGLPVDDAVPTEF